MVWSPQHRIRRRGFTLVELLVVIAIIGILVALLLPAVQAAREAARRAQCQSHLKNIVLAVHNYASAYSESLPPGGITEGPCCSTRSGTSWSISILPYLEEQNLYDQYDFSVPNDAPNITQPTNRYFLAEKVAIYVCPSDEDTDELERPESGPGNFIQMARGSYRANTGRCSAVLPNWGMWDSPSETDSLPIEWKGPFHTVGPYDKVRSIPKMKAITDGLSNTLFLGEATSRSTKSRRAQLISATKRRRTFWAYSYTSYNKSCIFPQTRTLLVDYGVCAEIGGPGGENPCKRAWGGLHPGGLFFAFGDGAVRFIEFSVDMEILAELSTMAGEEIPVY